MSNKADELLKQCLEIEGLLSLISTREDTTPDVVYAMLRDKVSSLEASVSNLGKSDKLFDASAECSGCSKDEEAIASSTQLEEKEDAFEKSEITDADSEDVAQDEPSDENGDVEVEFVYADNIADETSESDSFVESPSEFIPLEDASSEYDTPVSEMPEVDGGESFTNISTLPDGDPAEPEEEDDQEISPVLSDRFAEFTLNDKFRFRRELFGNSDIDMNEALDVVNAMTSREEVEDYFYNDMCWDPNNDDVKDFIRIVTAKFTH